MQMATGGCSMQRCPALTIASIDISPSLQELLCHLLEVINAALVQCSQAILIGQVGANPTAKELTDFLQVVSGSSLQKSNAGREEDMLPRL